MQEILKLLDDSKIVKNYEIIAYEQVGVNYFMKCKISLINETFLFVLESFRENFLTYSYHWQDSSDKLLMRWDNAPHHKEISTFPHHLHIGQQVEASYDPEFSYVLNEIEKIIKEQNPI